MYNRLNLLSKKDHWNIGVCVYAIAVFVRLGVGLYPYSGQPQKNFGNSKHVRLNFLKIYVVAFMIGHFLYKSGVLVSQS